MELWHHTEDAPRSPEAVTARQPVALWIGSWPVEMGQYVTVSWKATHASGAIETGSIQAEWQYNEPRNDNSYWLATLGPFLESDEVEYRIHGESKDGKISTPAYTFRVVAAA